MELNEETATQWCKEIEHHIARGDNEKVEKMLEQKLVLHWKNQEGNTMLHYASSLGYKNAVDCLVKHGSYVNNPNNKGKTPLILACDDDEMEITRILMNAKALYDDRSQLKNFLHKILHRGHSDLLALYMRNGYDVHFIYDLGDSSLHCGVFGSNKEDERSEIVEMLIKVGVNVNARNARGDTALHLAVKNNFKKAAKVLLSNQAEPNLKNCLGQTPLLTAVLANSVDLVKLLIDCGALVNTYDNGRLTPLHHAAGCSSCSLEVVKTLIENGASVNFVSVKNINALSFSMHRFNMEVKKKYIRRSSEFDQNIKYDTFIELHFKKELARQLDVMKILVENQSKIKFYQVISSDIFGMDVCVHSKFIEVLLKHNVPLDFDHLTLTNLVFDKKSNIPEVFLKHVAKYDELEIADDPYNFNYNKLTTRLRNYYNNCKNELFKMKKYLLIGRISLIDLLMKKSPKFYVTNEEVIDFLESRQLPKFFPIFKDDIKERFVEDQTKLKLLLGAAAGLNRVFGLNYKKFPFVVEKILSFLDKKDLYSLLQV